MSLTIIATRWNQRSLLRESTGMGLPLGVKYSVSSIDSSPSRILTTRIRRPKIRKLNLAPKSAHCGAQSPICSAELFQALEEIGAPALRERVDPRRPVEGFHLGCAVALAHVQPRDVRNGHVIRVPLHQCNCIS